MSTALRAKRKQHDHVLQTDVVSWTCPACRSIRPEVMTFDYGIANHRWLLANGIIPMYGNW